MRKAIIVVLAYFLLLSCSKPITLTSTPHIITVKKGCVSIVDTVKIDTVKITKGKVKVPSARYFTRGEDIDTALYDKIKKYSLEADAKYDMVVATYDIYDVSKDRVSVLSTQMDSGIPLMEYTWSEVIGNLSGETFFTPTELTEYSGDGSSWQYSKNLNASVVLKKDRDWWGNMCHQWTISINNISPKSWEKHFCIKILFFDKNNKLEGEQVAYVSDFVLSGESISKTIFYDASMVDCFFAEYMRLYVNNIYCGEFVNSIN